MSYPNQDQDVLMIVVGGGDDDPDPTQSGGVRCYAPSQYSDDVPREHLPFIRPLGSGSNDDLCSFGGAIEDGTAVIVRKKAGPAGTGHGYIVGVVKDDTNTGQTIPGNLNIRAHKAVLDALTRQHKINSKAKAGSGEANSKPTEEAGPKYSHDLLKGIPNSKTLWPITGMRIPQVKSVPTATQAFSAIMSPDALGSLPGMALSLGSLFTSMPSELMSQITQNMPEEVQETFNTMINLMPENSASGLSGIRVNPEVFFANAVELLSKCRSTADIVAAIQELLSNTALHGTDTLEDIKVPIETPFGTINVSFDVSGNSTDDIPDAIKKLIDAFTSMLSNSSGGFPGVFPDKNMWRESSQVMGDMMKRLKPEEYKKAVEQAQKSIAPGSDPRAKLNTFVATAMKGMDIMSG